VELRLLTSVPILLYHSVSADPPDWIAPFAVSPAHFARHLDAIAASGRVPLTVSQYVDGLSGKGALPQSPVLITIDDGFADFAENALPALASRNMCSTLYVTTGALAGGVDDWVLPPANMLAAGDLPRLEATGVEIGAHSHTHRQMDLLSEPVVATELSRNASILESILGHRIRSFAYPHGYWTPRVRRQVSAAGFDSACAVANAFSSDHNDYLALSRLMVRSDTGEHAVAAWMDGSGARPEPRHRALAFGWRQQRRLQVLHAKAAVRGPIGRTELTASGPAGDR
jgi:peptidoglycan/xylan/chitin deacetylase (PgdA/CDA1 family)